jgi:hypothetical protein
MRWRNISRSRRLIFSFELHNRHPGISEGNIRDGALQPLKHTPVYAKALARLGGRADEWKRAKTDKPSPEAPAGHADGFRTGQARAMQMAGARRLAGNNCGAIAKLQPCRKITAKAS